MRCVVTEAISIFEEGECNESLQLNMKSSKNEKLDKKSLVGSMDARNLNRTAIV